MTVRDRDFPFAILPTLLVHRLPHSSEAAAANVTASVQMAETGKMMAELLVTVVPMTLL